MIWFFSLALSFPSLFLNPGRSHCSACWLVALIVLTRQETPTRLAVPQSVPSLTLSIPRTMLHFHSGALRRPRSGLGRSSWIAALNHPLDFRSKAGVQLAAVSTFQLVGQCLYLAWQKVLFSNNMLFPCPLPHPYESAAAAAAFVQLQVWKRTDFMDFFLQWRNNSAALFLPSKPPDKRNTNCLFSSSDVKSWQRVFLISLGYERQRADWEKGSSGWWQDGKKQ